MDAYACFQMVQIEKTYSSFFAWCLQYLRLRHQQQEFAVSTAYTVLYNQILQFASMQSAFNSNVAYWSKIAAMLLLADIQARLAHR